MARYRYHFSADLEICSPIHRLMRLATSQLLHQTLSSLVITFAGPAMKNTCYREKMNLQSSNQRVNCSDVKIHETNHSKQWEYASQTKHLFHCVHNNDDALYYKNKHEHCHIRVELNYTVIYRRQHIDCNVVIFTLT